MGVTVGSLFQIAYTGLHAREQELDVISNNVANLETVGYKRFRAVMEDVALPSPEGESEGWLPGGTYLVATRRVVQQGPIEPTGRTWDLALDGPGFFQVQREGGGIAYTRDGTFRLDEEGRLVTSDGMPVLPQITVPAGAQDVYVDRDGTVLARINGQVQQVGVIQLARFPNPEGLRSIGADRYVATAASGPAQVAQAGSPGYAEIVSQALEMSNVDLTTEMMSLVVAQRAYGLALRMLQMADRMHELAVELPTR
ncbi:MAG: flagellar hook-basal body complex protein [Anaerolineae bacterium]|nr:flagellar hook-basal body complex protein [Anaerolineae bacterium]